MINFSLRHKYNLTFLNCAYSVYNVFDAEIDILDPKSFELKNRVREYVKTNYGTNKKVEFTAYIYYSKLLDYFKHNFKSADFKTVKSIFSDSELENIENEINKSGLNPNNLTLEKLIKNSYPSFFKILIPEFRKEEIENSEYNEAYKVTLQFFKKKYDGILEIYNSDNSELYFTFLILLLSDYGVLYIEEILNHHLNKTFNYKDFVKTLSKHIKQIPEPLKDDEILGEIKEWINKHSHLENIIFNFDGLVIKDDETEEKDLEEKKNTPVKNDLVQTGLQSLFIVKDWELYVDVLTKCKNPLLLKENNKYKFIGKNSGDRGIIASWFNYLKKEGKIAGSFLRDDIADILTKEILNYSISPSKVEDESKIFVRIKQSLINLLNISLSMNKHA